MRISAMIKKILLSLSGSILFLLQFSYRVRADAVYEPSVIPEVQDTFESILPWLLFFLLIGIIVPVQLAARCLMLNKRAGNGWRVLIPFYGRFLEYKYYLEPKYFWIETGIVFYIVIAIMTVSQIDQSITNVIISFILFFAVIFYVVILIRFRMSILEVFGYRKIFCLIALVGLGFILDFICGFSSKKIQTKEEEIKAKEEQEKERVSQIMSENLDTWD